MNRPLALAVMFAVTALPGLATAKPRVAIVQLEGDPGGEVQDGVVSALDGDLSLIGPKEVNRTVDKLGLDSDMSDKDLKKLANELEADAIVQGKVTSAKDDHKLIHFKLFSHGKRLKGFKIEFANINSDKVKSALHDKMVEKLGGGDDDGDAKASKKKKKGDDDADGDAKTAKKKKKGADDDADADAKTAKKKKKGGDDDGDDTKVAAKKKKGGDDDDSDAKAAAKKKKASDDDDADTKAALKHKSDDDEGSKKTAKSDDDADSKPKKKSDDDDSGDDKPKKKRVAAADDDDTSVSAGVTVEGKGGGHPANRDAIRLDAGMSFMNRRLTFNNRPNFPMGPKTYSNAPVPGGRVEGEVYPLAFSDSKSPLAGLGFAGLYDKTFSLALQNSAAPGMKFPVNEMRWDVGVRYRIMLGSTPTSPWVALGIGYGHRDFKVTRPAPSSGISLDVPDVEYVAADPGLEFRIPFIPAVALVGSASTLLMLRTGSIQQPEEYGQAKVTAFVGSGGLDIVIANRYALRLIGEFAQIGFNFTGNAAMTNNRDGVPTTKDVGGATDRYLGAAATLAVMY